MPADAITNVSSRVRKVLAAASNRSPDEISGSYNLGDPPPLGISDGLLKGMIPALDDIVHDYKPNNDVNFSKDIAPLSKVSELIGLVLKKCGISTN
jgi:hypothetical protein